MIKRELCVIPLVDVVVDISYIWRRCNLEHNVIFRCKSIDKFHHKGEKSWHR